MGANSQLPEDVKACQKISIPKNGENIMQNKTNETLSVNGCQNITIDVMKCEKITVNVSDSRQFDINIVDCKNYSIHTGE